MENVTNLSAKDLLALYVNQRVMAELDLDALGRLHIELRRALADVEEALVPEIVKGAQRGRTYVDLAVTAGYGSTTTITKIIREQGASPGRGSNQAPFRRRRSTAA